MNFFNVSEEILLATISEYSKDFSELKTCFLLTHVPNPRMNKRIRVYKNSGQVSVICTRRKSQNIWEPQVDGVDYYIYDVDLPSAIHIIKRTIMSYNYQGTALKKLKEIRPNVLYCGGLDSLLIAVAYKNEYPLTKIIYEVADLREAYITSPKNIVKRFINAVVKWKEARAFRAVDLLVVTSPMFFERYYNRLIKKENMVFIPNAPDSEVFANYKKKTTGKFTIGFIGGIRYLKQMKMLVDVAGDSDCEVVFAGAGGTSSEYEEIRAYCQNKKYVTFSGRYNYEKEVATLYGQVDCVYAVYDADNPNVRIALPNKLYESVVCELPIVVAKNTYLAELVSDWGVGIAVRHDSREELQKELVKLINDRDYYNKFVANCKEIKKDFLGDNLKQQLRV